MWLPSLQGKLLGVLFYEASTRTSCSFQAAMLRLGGGVVPLSNDMSSTKKGESLEGELTGITVNSCYSELEGTRQKVHYIRKFTITRVHKIRS